MGQGKIERRFDVFLGQDGDWWWRYTKRVGGVKNIMAGSTEGYKNRGDAVAGVKEMQEGPSLASIHIEGD